MAIETDNLEYATDWVVNTVADLYLQMIHTSLIDQIGINILN